MAKSIASRLKALEKMVARLLKPEKLMTPARKKKKKKKAKKKKPAAKKAARPTKAKKRKTKKRSRRALPVIAPMPVML